MSGRTRPTVLVVDDDPHVVAGLRRVLSRRRRWTIITALSGAEALEVLDREPVTVLLCDMRMPGMDGPELLRRVRASHPRVARIVLSGAADREASMEAFRVAHRYLAKPADAAELLDVVGRACSLRGRFVDLELTGALGAVDRLPSPPTVLEEVNTLLADPHAELRDVGAALEGDPALAAKILQTVNSAFFGLSQRQSSVSAAVSYLGIATVQAIIAMGSFGAATQGVVSAHRLLQFERRAQDIAHATKALVPTELHADAHAAGLLHDLGWLALAVTRPDLADDVTHGLTHGEAPLDLHPSHADVGAYLLDLWGLPETIVEAVALHHSPCAGAHRPVAHALQIAVALHLPSTDRTHPCLDPDHLYAHGLTDAVAAARPLTTTTIQ